MIAAVVMIEEAKRRSKTIFMKFLLGGGGDSWGRLFTCHSVMFHFPQTIELINPQMFENFLGHNSANLMKIIWP